MTHENALHTLLTELTPESRVCILTHNNPDPDALAAAFGLQYLFQTGCKCEAQIIFNGIIGRMNNRQMIKLLEIPVRHLSAIDLNDYDQLCLVDTQPGMKNNAFPIERSAFLVVDHHPEESDPLPARMFDLRKDAGSTSSIVCNYLIDLGIDIPSRLATALLYGIKTDTDSLSRDTHALDRHMYFRLYPEADPILLNRIERPDLPKEYYRDLGDALLSCQVFDNILIANLAESYNPDMPAEMADFLLRMESISVVLVYGHYKETTHFSLRTSLDAIHLGKLAITIVEGIGSAGGHSRAAGGQIPYSEESTRTLLERFYHFFTIEPGQFHLFYE